MKDIQGIQRGKCKSCDCEEYRTNPQAQAVNLRCEYCNHTPGEHVKIIELGACNSCGEEECDKYQSEDPNRYTDCGYCGCGADKHAGAEKYRKHFSSQQIGMAPSGQRVPQGVGMSSEFQPRQDAYGQPVQTSSYGTCNCPGCPYPKRVEGCKVYDFCSRTCANKFSEMQSSFYQQKMAAAQAVQQSGSPQVPFQSQPPLGGSPISRTSRPPPTTSGGGFFSSLLGPLTNSAPATGGPGGPGGPTTSTGTSTMPPTQPSGGSMTAGGKICSKCGVRTANPGKAWCQQCYQQLTS